MGNKILNIIWRQSNDNQNNTLVPIANLTPTPYLIIKPNNEYFFLTSTSLQNCDYDVQILLSNINDSSGHSFYLCHSSQYYTNDINPFGCKLTNSDKILGNVLLRKYKDQEEKIFQTNDIKLFESLY
jgi:hypothetical protein